MERVKAESADKSKQDSERAKQETERLKAESDKFKSEAQSYKKEIEKCKQEMERIQQEDEKSKQEVIRKTQRIQDEAEHKQRELKELLSRTNLVLEEEKDNHASTKKLFDNVVAQRTMLMKDHLELKRQYFFHLPIFNSLSQILVVNCSLH